MRLLVDAMCGTLSRYLRMAGHDAAYAPDRGLEADGAIARAAAAEGRLVLTRDAALAAMAEDAIRIESTDVRAQVAELRAAGVEIELTTPSRCGRCNGELRRLEGDEGTADYAPDPAVEAVWRCRDCGQFFWAGSHWDDVRARLAPDRATGSASSPRRGPCRP